MNNESKSYKDTVNERFIECVKVLKEKGGVNSDKEFAENIDLSPANYSDIKANRRSVTTEILKNANYKYKINSDYIINGILPHFKNELEPTGGSEFVSKKGNIHVVPTEAQAGYMAGFGDCDNQPEDFKTITIPGFNEPEYFAFYAQGDSMYPTICNGDMIVTTKTESLNYIRENEIYVILTSEGLNVKRLSRSEKENEYLLISDNNFYKPYAVHAKDIRCLFLVKGFVSQNTFPRNYFEERIFKIQSQLDAIKK